MPTLREHIESIRAPWSLLWVRTLTAISVCLTLVVCTTFVFEEASRATKRTTRMLSAGQVAGLLLLYASDYDQTLPPAESWMVQASVYTRNDDFFTSLKPIAYGFNPNLDGIELDSIPHPSRTPLITEVPRFALNALADPVIPYVVNGNALIAFADGDSRYIAPADYHSLSWSPGKPPLDQNPLR